jgi:uncharacterized membrane protein
MTRPSTTVDPLCRAQLPPAVETAGAQPAPVLPSGRRRRLAGVDASRGLALLGMIAVHSLYDSDSAGRPSLSFSIFGGRAAAAFAVLAGVGIAFMTDRRRVRLSAGLDTAAMLFMRALVIGAIGLALGYTDGKLAVVILPSYAVMFVLAVPLVFLPTWAIAATGAATIAGMPTLSHILLPHLPAPTLNNHSFGYLVNHPVRLFSELSVTGEFPALLWMAYVCAGLVIGRLTLTRARVAIGLLASGTVIAVAAAVASSLLLHWCGGLGYIWAAQPGGVLTAPETTELLAIGGDGTTPTSTWWWLAVDAPHTGTPFDLAGTTGTAIALLGVMLLGSHLPGRALRRLSAIAQAPLAAAGSMTLTLYAAHIIFINSDYDTYGPHKGYLLQVIVVLLFGLAWRATAGRGPLEGLVTMLTERARSWAATASRRPPSQAAVTTESAHAPR